MQGGQFVKLEGPELGTCHKIVLPLVVLFIALFRLALFITLPQYSPMTYFITDIIAYNYEIWIVNGVRFLYMLDYFMRKATATVYQATEDLIASFIPWLCVAFSLTIAATIGRLCNSIIFWTSILPKLWSLDSEHRSIAEIFTDPTRRDFLLKEKPRYRKNLFGKVIDREPIPDKEIDELLDKWFDRSVQTVDDPLQKHGNKEEKLRKQYWRKFREFCYPCIDRWRANRAKQHQRISTVNKFCSDLGLCTWTAWMPSFYHVIFSFYFACLFDAAFVMYLGRIFQFRIGWLKILLKHCLN